MTRVITENEEQAYRLCSPDFYGLTYKNAALLLHCHLNTVCVRLKRLKAKAPQLFYKGFIRPRTPHTGNPNDYDNHGKILSYESWMDNHIIVKF